MKVKFDCCFCNGKNEKEFNLRKNQGKFSIDTISIKCKECKKINFAIPRESRREND